MYDCTDSIYFQNQQRIMSQSQHRQSSGTYTSESVLVAVQRFVTTVNTMNETIMVPSRLLDMEVGNNKNRPLPELLQTDKDPYAVYGILNTTKNDLLYGLTKEEDDDDDDNDDHYFHSGLRHDSNSDRWSSPSDSNSITNNLSPSSAASPSNSTAVTVGSHKSQQQQHVRRESTLSMMSVTSSNSDSSTESDIVEESQDAVSNSDGSDSALGSDDATCSTTNSHIVAAQSVVEASSQMRGHLLGLYSCLSQLSETATYITDRYQEEILK